MKKYYKQILIVICFSILLIIIYSQYKKNQMYETYISESLNNETRQLVVALVQSNRIYQEVLRDREIKKIQVDLLNTYNNHLIEIPEKHEVLAYRFNRVQEKTIMNETAMNAEYINNFFNALIGESQPLHEDEFDDVIDQFNQSSELRRKIKELRDLNILWIEAASHHFSGVTIDKDGNVSYDNMGFIDHLDENSLKRDSWVGFLNDLDQVTSDYLRKKQVKNIDEMLNH